MLVLPWTKNQVSVEVHGIGIWYIGQGGINEVVLFIWCEDCSCFYTISESRLLFEIVSVTCRATNLTPQRRVRRPHGSIQIVDIVHAQVQVATFTVELELSSFLFNDFHFLCVLCRCHACLIPMNLNSETYEGWHPYHDA